MVIEQGETPSGETPVIQQINILEPFAQIYWARLTRLIQLRQDIDSGAENGDSATPNFFIGKTADAESSPAVNIRPTTIHPFQYAPGVRRGVLRGIYGSWRQLSDMGYSDLANTLVNYDRNRQGIKPGSNFQPTAKRK